MLTTYFGYRVWSLSSRGRQDVERILVEGAGSQNANGIYYRIDGLANGELYSKREVACGQQYVYTISISVNKEEEVECRLFCSKLLTHGAVKSFVRNSNGNSAFQPLLQVIQIDTESPEDTNTSRSPSRRKSTKVSLTDFLASVKRMQQLTHLPFSQLHLSDGEHYLTATMTPQLRSATRNGEIVENTLLKVLDYEKYVSDDAVTLLLKKVSIVSQDPGQRFGNPSYYYDVFDEENEDDGQPIISTDTPIETQICHELMQRQDTVVSKEVQTLVELYSSKYPLEEKPIDSKIMSTGWCVDSHGTAPGPRCRWISARARNRSKSPKSPNASISATAISSQRLSNSKSSNSLSDGI